MKKIVSLLGLLGMLASFPLSAQEPPKENRPDSFVFSFHFPPDVAITIDTLHQLTVKNQTETTKGKVGLSLIGNCSGKDYFSGLFTAFFLENVAGKNFYGLFFGLQGNWQKSNGLEIALFTKNELSRGIQTGLLGNLSTRADGIQLSGLVNMVHQLYGLQIAPFNVVGTSAKRTASLGSQFGIINQSNASGLLQIGLVNIQQKKGLQLGLLNYSSQSWIPYFPLINFAF